MGADVESADVGDGMKTLAGEWASARRLIPATAPAAQFQESRRFFYAGARAFLYLLMANLEDTGNDDDVTPRDEAIMQALQGELDQFAKDLAAGRA